MAQDIRIPDIGDAEDVEVVEILAAVGDEVGEDDPLIVIESDKASMEVPAGARGTVESIEVAVGDTVSEGQVIARLADAAGGSDDDTEAAETADDDAEADEAEPDEAEDDDSAGDESTDDQPAEDSAEDEGQGEEGEEAEDDGGSAESAKQASGSRSVEVKVPDIGEAENVEVIEVAVKVGDTVAADDMLVVVESDKASMEIPSSHGGTVEAVHVEVGSQVEEGTLLVTLRADADGAKGDNAPAGKGGGESRQSAAKQTPAKQTPAKADADSGTGNARPAKAAGGGADKPAAAERSGDRQPPASSSANKDVYAGPAVRRLARELGVELTAVEGTGSRGRIVKDDVKAHVKGRMTGAAPGAAAVTGIPPVPAVDFSRFGEVEEQPLSRIRARGAENLHRSWLNIPHVTQHDEVDITDLEDFRGTLKAEGERRGIKVTPLAFIIKACCHVLKEFPTVNASLDPAAKTFLLKHYYNIGMAVDTPDGLVVPVIKNADRKGVWELSEEIVELAQKARDNKLGMGDLQGGSFSVSSLGAIGGTGFTPIINAPEVAILGVGRLTMRPVWRNDGIEPRKMLPLSLSYDHRAINGAEAGRFVTRLAELLNDLRRLAL